MKERGLTIRSDNDETTIKLEDNKHKEFKECSDNIGMALYTLGASLIEKGEGKQNTANLICQSMEIYTSKMHKLLNYDSKLNKDMEERHATIRGLNQENRELRAQIGATVTNEHVREKLKNIDKSIGDWWNSLHLGYLHTNFHNYGIQVIFKVAPYLHLKMDSSEDEAKFIKKHSKELGLKLSDGGKGGVFRHPDLLDTEKNKKIIHTLVKTKYPSAKLEDIKIYYKEDKDTGELNSTINEITYFIRNYDEVDIKQHEEAQANRNN